jgi:hypothetical protein
MQFEKSTFSITGDASGLGEAIRLDGAVRLAPK